MPIYSYKCPSCMRERDLHRNLEDRNNEPTCLCGKTMLRVSSPPSLQFKGSGFHSTDYGPHGPKAA